MGPAADAHPDKCHWSRFRADNVPILPAVPTHLGTAVAAVLQPHAEPESASAHWRWLS